MRSPVYLNCLRRCFRFAQPATLAAALIVLVACSSLPLSKPQSPSVTVAGVRPISFSLTSQTIGLTLRVENPNGFDLPMQSLTFNARFAGEQFAQGSSTDEVVIPANGQALLEVEVKTGLGKLASQLGSMLNSNDTELNYDVTGLVKLANWPKPIAFNVEGELDDPRVKK